jgi:cyclophilin family peptidyl-prolyl cis-trans isomerase/HEAT repeat protein
MAAVLDDNGQPRLRWWPIVYALQRVEDSKTLPALRALVRDPHANTRFFAIKGLGVLRDRSATTLLLPLVGQADQRAALEAVRALGRIGDRAAVEPLIDVVISEAASPTLRVEAIASLGAIGGEGVTDLLIDLFSNRSAALRAAAIQALAALDPFSFVAVLSGFELDRDWTVRVALARALGTQTPEAGLPRLRLMLTEQDQRVIPAVLDALEKLRAPEIMDVALKRLGADDPAVRTAAARIIERLKPAQGAAALAAAYQFGERDATYIARAAALTAIAAYGAGDATPVLTTALKDPDWAVRRRAATLLGQLDPSSQADARIRPAPTHLTREVYEAPRVLAPTVSPHAYIDTDRGTIQIELDVVEAPLTVENFVGLARRGFFDGLAVHRVVPNFVIQTGDPRGDSEGGPGYSIRDELNQRSYLRGTVGMALDWADTGGSQFFITLMPQPQLDAAYTAFGRVISGMEAADRLVAGDVVRRIRIWDGTSP